MHYVKCQFDPVPLLFGGVRIPFGNIFGQYKSVLSLSGFGVVLFFVSFKLAAASLGVVA